MVWTLIRSVRFQRQLNELSKRCREQVRALVLDLQVDPRRNDGRVPELLRKRYQGMCFKRRCSAGSGCANVVFFRIIAESTTVVLVDIYSARSM